MHVTITTKKYMTSKSYPLNRLFVLASIAMLLVSTSLRAQQAFGGEPLAVQTDATLRTTQALETELVSLNFNPSDIAVQDAWSAPRSGRPLNVGHLVDYKVDFAERAQLVLDENGTEVYRLDITLEGTPVGIGLYYDDFYIPKGGRLFIYTPGGRQLLGAYTEATHPRHGAFATEPLAGNRLILDYERPQGVEMPSIQISSVAYLYIPVMQAAQGQDGLEMYQGNEDNSDPSLSSFCQINANCPEGDDYQDQKASSVAMLMPMGGGVGMCSGNLINNVEGDLKPYIISAAHCASLTDKYDLGPYALDQWIFGFHYEKPRCSSGDRATQTLCSMVGASLKSFIPIVGASDGLLLELKGMIPPEYRVYYSGWDATQKVWQKGAGLHHPAGDALKVSVFDGGVSIATWNEKRQGQGGKNAHFQFQFTKGNTEGGSSGSPLYNDRGNQIGTLSGGVPGICPKDGMYGRMYYHFDQYKEKGDTWYMAKWLDPKGTGRREVNGMWNGNWKPLGLVKELRATISNPKTVKLEWDAVPAHVQGYAITYNLYRNNKLVTSQLTTTSYEDALSEKDIQAGQVSYKVEASYKIEDKDVTTPAAHRSVYLGELVSRVEPKVSKKSSGVELRWKKPYNTQIVSKIETRERAKLYKASHGTNSYGLKGMKIHRVFMCDLYRLGQSPLGGQKLYIHQINFVPAMDTPLKADGKVDYNKALRFYALQKVYGSARPFYDTPVIVPQGTANKKEWMSVQLNQPIPLDDAYNLEVGFICPSQKDEGVVFVDTRSKDEYINTDGCLIKLEVSGDLSFETYPGGHYSEERMGYQALELVVSDNPDAQDGTTSRAFTRGKLPVPFPAVKGYKVYRNGKPVKDELLSPETLKYKDAEGKDSDKYYVEVIYADYPNELRPIEQITQVAPELYPVHFAETLQLSNPDEVLRVQLFNLQGVAVAEFSGAELAGLLDVSRLPEGAYVAVVTTADGATTQKLVK